VPSLAPIERAPTRTLTKHEKTETLDAELEAGLGEYDELLLREQARVKADRPHRAGDGEGIGGDAGGKSGGGADSAGSDGEMTDAGIETPPTASAGGNGKQQTVVSGQPENIPDGSDDDVVARQLRKAAEQETDPELKKKLWEEYRKYKQGTR
jgi:hypothetical protein